MADPVLVSTPNGLHCPAGNFFVDPLRPVDRAVITHGHADHARSGSKHYWSTELSHGILQHRLKGIELSTKAYGEVFELGDARVSFHPAGHVLGSAQVRVEVDGEVWVVSGDYKRAPDPTCGGFEVVECDTFITEATFALPVYQWPSSESVTGEILRWWDTNIRRGKASVLLCYALGKAQRVLGELAALTSRGVLLHGAIDAMVDVYRACGIDMLPTEKLDGRTKRTYAGELIVAPPSVAGSAWLRRIGDCELAFASGWMRLRGARRRRGTDRGFVLSDHADWWELVRTVRETKAHRVLATHGYTDALVRFLREEGINAETLNTDFDRNQEDG